MSSAKHPAKVAGLRKLKLTRHAVYGISRVTEQLSGTLHFLLIDPHLKVYALTLFKKTAEVVSTETNMGGNRFQRQLII